MINTGFIIVPTLDTDRVELVITALLFMQVLAAKTIDIAKNSLRFIRQGTYL